MRESLKVSLSDGCTCTINGTRWSDGINLMDVP